MTNIQAQNQAWKYAPKAFREAVKKLFAERFGAISTYGNIMSEIFGKHNLTSDADGEEMLTVSRKRVQEMYAHYDKISNDPNRPKDYIESVYEYADGVTIALYDLFGSKCLPDDIESLSQNPPENCDNENHISTDDNKPAEPKFKVGDKAFYVCSITVKHKCTVMKVKQNEHSGKWEYNVLFDYGKPGLYIPESDLEPYIEPKKRKKEGNTGGKLENPQSDKIANCDNQFDNILKDNFRNERRLNIAAMMAQALLTRIDDTPQVIADTAFRHADALITESEKGGSHEKA